MNKELDRKAKEIVVREYLSDKPEGKEWWVLFDEIMDISYEFYDLPAGDVVHDVLGAIMWSPFHELPFIDVEEAMVALHDNICATFGENFHEED